MIDLSTRFSEFSNANFFSRVDNEHNLELHIGLDEKARKAIELRAKFKPRKISGTSSIEVNQYKKDEYNTIRFSLCDNEVAGLFYKFCDDLIEQTRDIKDRNESYQAIINRYFQWKKMFVSLKGNLLSENEVMGLIGEILFLRGHLADRIGLHEALNSWSGQELTHKDFSYQNAWFEVKAINRGSQTVKISSLEQLDSNSEGELVVHALEKMSSTYNGITLNKLILETFDMFDLGEDKDLFMAKVSLHGYEYNTYYDDFVYEVSSFTRYKVHNNFPKLTKDNMPWGIVKASYEINIMDIKDFILGD